MKKTRRGNIFLFLFHCILFLSISSKAFAEENLIFSVDLIRHGDRTPEKAIPASPYAWKEGLGELTPRGMNQEYQLGASLRKKYIDRYHLLPEHYLAETLYVRSTDINRTLMSAESFLLGLYPLGTGPLFPHSTQFTLPSGFQPIPIHTVPHDQDTLLTVKPSRSIFSWMSLYSKTNRAWDEQSMLFKDKLKKWNEATGLQLKTLREIESVGDNFYIRQLYHIPLPKGMTAEDAKEIMTIGAWSFLDAFKQKEVTYPMGHAFLLAVSNAMQDAIQRKSPLKYILFSGHDATIMAVMTTLGSPLHTIPHYASDLNFSLWKNNNDYYITVNLNNEPVMLPGCEKNNCTLSEFDKIVKK